MEYLVPDIHHQMLLLFSHFSFPFIHATSQIQIPPSSLCFPALFSSLDPLGRWTFPTHHAASALQKAAIMTQALTPARS